jgi:pimeloyl-ACP methyl ester carboxylesterase
MNRRYLLSSRQLAILFAVATALSVPAVATAQDQFFDSNGVRIHYVEKGRGEPLVLVHGLTGSIATWSEFGVIDKLAAKYHVIVFDVRGHGASGKPHDPNQYGQEMALDVIRLLDHLHIDTVHIVGYSMGGGIVAQLLTLRPERLRTATIGGLIGRFEWTAADAELVELEAKEVERDGVSRTVLSRAAGGAISDDEFQRRKAAFFANGQDPLAHAAIARATAALVIDKNKIAAVSVPILAIVGSRDGFLSQFRELKKIRPATQLIVLDGATHSGQTGVRARPEFIEAIGQFVNAHSAH